MNRIMDLRYTSKSYLTYEFEEWLNSPKKCERCRFKNKIESLGRLCYACREACKNGLCGDMREFMHEIFSEDVKLYE